MHNVWKTWGVSVPGPRHRKENKPNQDAWLSRVLKGGSVLAVSDGLGSKPFSDTGSKAACLSVIEACKVFIRHSQGDSKSLPEQIHTFWVQALKSEKLKPKDCAATCLFAIQIHEKIILGRLGDGLIIATGKNNEVILEDVKTDSFSNVTECLNDSYKACAWEIKEISAQDFEVIILCTDGIANDIESEKRHDFVLSIYECYKTMERKKRSKEITKWLNKWPVPGHSDDKTLACLYRTDLCNA
jgi:serine/threonine protein phosphatase PrpC